MIRLLSVAVVVLLAAASAFAQEFEIFDPNDFVDPRVRGAEFRPIGIGLAEPGDDFAIIRAYTGRVTDYQWRNEPTEVDLSFIHVTGTWYREDRQLNLKLTAFNPDEGNSALPRYRGTAQFGYYFATHQRLIGDDDDTRRVAGRLLVSYSFEDATVTDNRIRDFTHEYGIEADIHARLGRLNIMGSFIWTRRWASEDELVDRYTYIYRPPDLTYRRLHLTASLGGGIERSATWQSGALRGVFTGSYELPFGIRLNASYAPAYLPGRDERRSYHELAIYVDRTVLTRLVPR